MRNDLDDDTVGKFLVNFDMAQMAGPFRSALMNLPVRTGGPRDLVVAAIATLLQGSGLVPYQVQFVAKALTELPDEQLQDCSVAIENGCLLCVPTAEGDMNLYDMEQLTLVDPREKPRTVGLYVLYTDALCAFAEGLFHVADKPTHV